MLQLQGDSDRAREMYEDTMRLAREIGFQAVEAMAVGNLGDLLLEQGLLEESGQRLLQSIGSMDGLDSSSAGAFRGSLAWVRAQEGQFGEARELLKVGEGQLRGVWAVELGRLLCRRAQVEHLAGAEATAHVALDEAKRIAEQMGAGPESDLGQLLAEAEPGFAGATDGQESD